MNEDEISPYLWDGTGEDAEVQKLEALLGDFKHDAERPAPVVQTRSLRLFALAACALLLVGAALTFALLPRAGFDVVGEGLIAGRPLAGQGRLPVGALLETLEGEAQVQVADIGALDVAPRSRLRLVETREQLHHLALERGRIDAVVDAPPRLLVVDTPSATAIDLGCVYTLEVDEAGDGRLAVDSGWVELAGAGKRAYVVAGMAATFDDVRGPSVPVRTDAHPSLEPAVRARNVEAAIAVARDVDAVTLWHLIERTEGASRRAVVEHLARLTPVDVDGAMAADRFVLDRWLEVLPR